uniref:ATP synthase F0 subunit 8 n=1 Tax=Scrobicularia plana TaxID=665965 RepID=A0A6H2U240_9BIVA|nr:ATP synthase F0 subunit 8 [Scrobicularia plana]
MPQMAPFYWGIMLLLIWVVLVSVCALIWWVACESSFFFNYKE